MVQIGQLSHRHPTAIHERTQPPTECVRPNGSRNSWHHRVTQSAAAILLRSLSDPALSVRPASSSGLSGFARNGSSWIATANRRAGPSPGKHGDHVRSHQKVRRRPRRRAGVGPCFGMMHVRNGTASLSFFCNKVSRAKDRGPRAPSARNSGPDERAPRACTPPSSEVREPQSGDLYVSY